MALNPTASEKYVQQTDELHTKNLKRLQPAVINRKCSILPQMLNHTQCNNTSKLNVFNYIVRN